MGRLDIPDPRRDEDEYDEDAALWHTAPPPGRGHETVAKLKHLHDAGRLVEACDGVLARARAADFVPDRLMISVANSIIAADNFHARSRRRKRLLRPLPGVSDPKG